tara:strand:+ start:261 stop:503 length:243 start_codon:yes stop_codon:yes gene_type:complete
MILVNIDGMPLFSTLQEALDWGSQNGLSGYHTHVYFGQIGYMGGETHASALSGGITTIQTTTVIGNSSGSSNTGSSGGGY